VARLVLVGTVLWALGAARALAASPPPARTVAAQAQALVDEGVRAFKADRFAEALDRFQRAYEATGDPKVLYLVARAQEELGDLAAALRSYRAFAQADVPADARDRAQRAARKIERLLGRGRLVIQVEPFGARISVDGEPAGIAPLKPLDLPAGMHEVRVEAPGFEAQTHRVQIPGHGEASLALSLRRLPPDPASSEGPTAPPAPPAASSWRPWAWTALGVGAALGLGGAATWAWGDGDHRSIAEAPGYDTPGAVVQMDYARAVALRDRGDTKKLAGQVLVGVGSAALVTGVVLLLLDEGGADADAAGGAEPRLTVGAAPGAGGARLLVGGRF